MNLGTRNKIKVEAGTASMTDLVFLLLIFFIIISLTASNNHTPVDLPKPSENLKSVQDPVTTTIVITDENKYFLSQTEKLEDARDFDLIKDKISKEVNDSGKLKLKIAGHKKADYEAVFQILALAQANGWEPVLAYQK
ncbi:MAG: biopolymer transporter ExbD [Crocinitomicaceae bacterium]|nr:biopolymer transporter ExbD [Crocinitomicaceae bacterium]